MILHNICIEQGNSLSKKLNLTFNPDTLGKRNRDEIRELLQMTDCPKTKDKKEERMNKERMNKERLAKNDALCQKVWLEKETGEVS
jgi:hypothetical protein